MPDASELNTVVTWKFVLISDVTREGQGQPSDSTQMDGAPFKLSERLLTPGN